MTIVYLQSMSSPHWQSSRQSRLNNCFAHITCNTKSTTATTAGPNETDWHATLSPEHVKLENGGSDDDDHEEQPFRLANLPRPLSVRLPTTLPETSIIVVNYASGHTLGREWTNSYSTDPVNWSSLEPPPPPVLSSTPCKTVLPGSGFSAQTRLCVWLRVINNLELSDPHHIIIGI